MWRSYAAERYAPATPSLSADASGDPNRREAADRNDRLLQWGLGPPAGPESPPSSSAPTAPARRGLATSELFERHGRPEQRRLQRCGRPDGDHDGVPAGIEVRIDLDLPVVRDPDVARGVNRPARNAFNGVGLVARGGRDRIADLQSGRALLRLDAAESGDSGRNDVEGRGIGRLLGRLGAEVEDPYGVVTVDRDPPRQRDPPAHERRAGMRCAILGLDHRHRGILRRAEHVLRRARRIEPIGIRHPHVALAVDRVADRMAEHGLAVEGARYRIDQYAFRRDHVDAIAPVASDPQIALGVDDLAERLDLRITLRWLRPQGDVDRA